MDNYNGLQFFAFFKLLLLRLLSGEILHLETDEVQILALAGIALTASFLGTFLVLRNMTMVANALSHTILIGIVLCYLLVYGFANMHVSMHLTHLFIASCLSALLTTLLTEFLKKGLFLQEDASIGLVFTTFFAIGILLVTLFTKNHHIGVELVTGNVDAIKRDDLKTIFGVFLINTTLFLLFFKEFKLITFDPSFSKTLGIPSFFFNLMLVLLTAFVAVSAFRAVGVLMVLAFFVIPPLFARLFALTLKKMITLSCLISVTMSVLGVAISRHLLTTYGIGISTAGIIVTLLALAYFLALSFRSLTFRKSSLYYRFFP